MSKIQILNDSFCKFLNLSKLRESIESQELLVQINKDNMICKGVFAKANLNLLCFKGILKGTFEDWGDLGIGTLPQLTNFINLTETKQIFLKKTENKLICELGNVKFSSVLRNPKYINNNLEDEKYNLVKNKSIGNEFILKSKQVKEIVSCLSKIKATKIFFSGDAKQLILKTENQNGDELVVNFDVESVGISAFTCKVSIIFVELLKTLTDYDLTVSMKNNCPIFVGLEKDELKFEFFVAPLED